MSFLWPHVLWLLIPVAVLAVWDAVRRGRAQGERSRPKILRAWAGHRRASVGNGRHVTRSRLLLWIGLALGVTALARPQWGRIEEPVFDESREIVIALDLSRSMLSTDVRPSRLERAKLLIRGLLDSLHGERVGLVVFAGTAFLQVPLSSDYEVFNEFLPSLKPSYMPVGGTNYAAMLRASINAFTPGSTAGRYLIILSDGGSLDNNWRSLLGQLKEKRIRVIALGVGTPEGSFIPDGSGGYVKDERGAVVLSKLDSTTLRELAKATDGVYTDASSWVDLGALLKRTVAMGRRGAFEERHEVRLVDRYQWALAPALLCLLLSFWREFPVQPRVRSLPLGKPAGRATAGAPPPALSDAGRPARRERPLTTTLTLALLCLLPVWFGSPARAAEDTTAYAAPLSTLVQQLAAQPTLSAQDYASLADATITWGGRLKEAHQPVMPGPVNDALLAVQRGEKLNAGVTDWAKDRRELEKLLEKPPKPPPQKKPPPQPKNQNGKNKENQQNKEKSPGSGGGSQGQPNAPKSSPSRQNQPPQRQPRTPESKHQQPPAPKAQPPPSAQQPNTTNTQTVGGQSAPEDDRGNPSLALPYQKLDQLRSEDSPGELFRMLDNHEYKSPPKKGRDW